MSDMPKVTPEPCQGCPDRPDRIVGGEPTIPHVEGMPDTGLTGWVVYGGGPPERHLAMMQHVLPADYNYGQFLPNGTIQYEKRPGDWEPPSPVEGYVYDEEDSWSLHPLWKSCQLRMFGARVKEACDCIQVMAVCNHPEVQLDSHGEVSFETCETCPHRIAIPEGKVGPKRSPIPEPFTPSLESAETDRS